MVAGVPPSRPSTPFTVLSLAVSLRRLDTELHAGGCNDGILMISFEHFPSDSPWDLSSIQLFTEQLSDCGFLCTCEELENAKVRRNTQCAKVYRITKDRLFDYIHKNTL